MSWLIDAYRGVSEKVVKTDKTWYVIGAVVVGLALGVYIWYLKSRVRRWKTKAELEEAKAMHIKHKAKQAERKEEIKRLNRKASKQQKRANKARQRLESFQTRHKRIDTEIDRAKSLAELREISDKIDAST